MRLKKWAAGSAAESTTRTANLHAMIMIVIMFSSAMVVCSEAAFSQPSTVETADDRAAADDDANIRFNFQDATFQQVIDFFSRATGLPVVWETDVPQGNLSYISPDVYTRAEALRVLNIILQSRGVMLRVDDDMLYLQKLSDMVRENIPTYIGELPGSVTSDQIVSVVRPLQIALAKPLSEKLASMIAEYGSITPLEQQNSVLITETAAQIRRIMGIIDELDREDPDGVIEIIPVHNASVTELMVALQALLSQKVEKYVINQQGQQVKIEEESLPGLNITPDVRTNSIVAKGVQSRIDKLREAVELLDVPATAGKRTMRTYQLLTLTARQAEQHLNKLFEQVKKEEKPTVVSLTEQGQVTVIGSADHVREATTLLAEVDGGVADPAGGTGASGVSDDRTMALVRLEQSEPQSLIAAIQGVMNERQKLQTKIVAGPDGRSVIISGFARDVQSIEKLIPMLDRAQRVDQQVRLLRLTSANPIKALNDARTLYDKQVDATDVRWLLDLDFDPESSQVTMIGTQAALARFSETLQLIEQRSVVERETRQITITNAQPSTLTGALAAMARQLLDPRDGSAYVEPQFDAVDALDMLIVSARPDQFQLLDSLIATLDRPTPGDFQFQTVSLTSSNVQALIAKADMIYERLTVGRENEPHLQRPDVEFDSASGNLMISGRSEAVSTFERALAQARQLMPPDREGRLISLQQANASEIATKLSELLATTQPVDPARRLTEPEVRVVEETNALYIVAEPAQHAMIERYVRELDTFEPTAMPQLRLLQIRAADAMQIATLLRNRYQNRPAQLRRDQPVEIDADAGSNVLIVSAHADVFDDIKTFVDEINRSGDSQAERETMIFTLQRARATDLAQALDRLYPQPPMPRDRRGQPLPHLQAPKEVQVSADPATNTLIVEAPAERREQFDALVEQLDRVELPPQAELRTFRIERGDPAQIAQTLTELARQGVLSELPPDGSKPVAVTIQAEQVSRTLIVAGDAVTFEKVEQMLRDLQAVPIDRELRVFEVVSGDPQEIAARAVRLYEQQTADVPDARPVELEVDKENGTVLVVAEADSMLRFARVFNELTASTIPPPDVRLIALEHAEAADVVTFLSELGRSELAMIGQRGPEPMFQAVERTNSILVAAQREQHDVIRALIESMDVQETRDTPPLRILQLRTADAANIASALERQYAQRPVDQRNTKPVSITADAQTNTLIVAAHPDVLPEIQGIVDELNQTDRRDYEGREIRIFPLKIARAEELARTIDEMYPEPPIPLDTRGRQRPDLQKPREIIVRADRQTNALIVDAPIQRMSGFENLVEQLDRAKLADKTQIRTYSIVHADLAAVANAIRELASSGGFNEAGADLTSPITVSTEQTSSTLIVSGPTGAFARIDQIISELDARRTGPATELRFFKLEFAQAETLAGMLREVLVSRLSEDVPDAGSDVDQLLNVTADRKTNTLIISAPEAMMPVAEQLIEQLDNASAAVGEPVIRVRPLTFADATEVSSSLSTAMANMVSKVTGEQMSVKLIATPGSNAIILVGPQDDLKEIESLIEPLDARPALDAIDAKTFALEHADAATIAPVVQNLLTDQQLADPRLILERIRRSRGDLQLEARIRVEADQRTNALIVSGPQRTVALAESLISQLDRADDTMQRVVRTYTPARASVDQLTATVQQVLDSTQSRGRQHRVELVAEAQSGAVIVIGPEHAAAEALAMLSDWDERTPTAPAMDLRIVELGHSRAEVLASALGPMLSDRSRWPQQLRSFVQAGLAISEPKITADVQRNRLLVSAPTELMPLASRLIAELDQPRSGSEVVDVRVFTLTTSDAAQVGQAVQASLDARAQQDPSQPSATVTVETSSNALIVAATPGQLDQVQRMVASLEQSIGSGQSQVRTVFLKHARAERVAPVVQELLGQSLDLDPMDFPQWARMEVIQTRMQMDSDAPPLRVAADSRLNAIMLTGGPGMLNLGEQLVTQLDVDSASFAGAAKRSVRVLAVQNADAESLAMNIEELFALDETDDVPPVVRVDATSNTLLVQATDAQFASIEQLVNDVDRATIATSGQMQLIPIDPGRANARDVANTLERMLRQSSTTVEVMTVEDLIKRRGKTTTGSTSPSSPAPGSTSMLPTTTGGHGSFMHGRLASVTATLASMVIAMPTFAAPDQPPGALHEPPSLRSILHHASTPAPAASFGLISGAAHNAQDAAQSDDETLADVTIAVDESSNTLVVIGSPRSIERVRALAAQIEQQIPASPGRVRLIALPDSADAQSLARLIDSTLRTLVAPGGERGALRNRVSVLADPATNALVVSANDTDFEVVADLIAALAQPPAQQQMIVKVYPLTTITADRALTNMQQLISPESAGYRRRPRQAERIRTLALRLLKDDASVDAVFDPGSISVASDPLSNSLIVMAPPSAVAFIDQYIELIDQSPVNTQSTLKLYQLRFAQSDDISRTLGNIFRNRFRAMRNVPGASQIEPTFTGDVRTNTLLATASPEQMTEVDELVALLDRDLAHTMHALTTIELQTAAPTRAAELLEELVVRIDPTRRDETLILPDDNSGLLLVRASDEVLAEIRAVITEIDRDATEQFEVRTITLERADPAAVAQTLQQLYDDRARIASTARGRRERGRRVSIVGNYATKTLLVAASDEDFAQISDLVAEFDSPQATDALEFKVFELKHAKASEINQTLQALINDLTWNQGNSWMIWGQFGPMSNQQERGTLAIRADSRLNAIIATGEGDKFLLVEQLIDVLDAAPSDGAQRIVRLFPVRQADLSIVESVVSESFSSAREWWQQPASDDLRVRADARNRVLIVSGTAAQVELAGELVAQIDAEILPTDQSIQVLSVQYADARELSQTLARFLADRASAINAPQPSATIIPSPGSNALVVSANETDLATLRDLLSQLDVQDVSGNRRIEIIALQDGDADEIARIVREQFAARGRGTQGFIITPDIRTNSLIVSAPLEQFEQAQALIAQLDTRSASDETIIRTYSLETAQARDVVAILTDTLQLDTTGETTGITIRLDELEGPAVEVNARIVADPRSNSLIVTATEESFPVIETLIQRVDSVPTRSPVEYRIIPLRHAIAADISFTLRSFTRDRGDGQPAPRIDYNRVENQLIIAATVDQFEQINKILAEIDLPSETQRITDFVPLNFAQAEQVQEALSVFYGPLAIEADTPGRINARIVADPATNSLVISAEQGEWENIRALLEKLDSEEYDSSLQLKVLPLMYADARSVAQAVNDAFQGRLERDRNSQGARDRGRQNNNNPDDQRRDPEVPDVLIQADEWVRAAAEPQTNSVIISASRQNLRKVEGIIEQLDVADYAKLPPPQLIPVISGDPQRLAESLIQLYEQDDAARGRKSLRIVPDQASSTLIVRAEDEDFQQIRVLADALQQASQAKGLSVKVLKLANAPAARVADAIRDAYEAKAEQQNQPLSIDIDAMGNNLIIAAGGNLFDEISRTVQELDALAPAAGQGIFIIELEHITPEQAKTVIETIGLHQRQPADSISRIVTEPIKTSLLSGRNAIVVLANPADRETIVSLLKAIDAEPELAESTVRIVQLKRAEAGAVAQLIGQLLTPGQQQSQTALARAVQEQIRRLSVRRDGLDESDLDLDLTQPIRVIPSQTMNALVLSSTAANVEALEQIVQLFDTLPITDAVTVQLFPLENISVDNFIRVVRELFQQGAQLATVPGTNLRGVPAGVVGRALLDQVAMAADERTNTVIVAGKEDAVAFVEVMARRMDTDTAIGWVEPRIIPLKHADSMDLAQTLRTILVEGSTNLPQSTPMQRQVARLRMARVEGNGGQVLESEVFQPMSRLVIEPEQQTNSLIVVGTPINIEVVTELVGMLDIEAASPQSLVRIYPVEHASATRIGQMISRLFQQQQQRDGSRDEDRVIIEPDERTNALVISTSARSFTMVEHLLSMLDSETAPELAAIRQIELEFASAARVAQLVQRMMDGRVDRLRRFDPQSADLERVTVEPDARTNSLLIAASEDAYKVIEQLVNDLDRSNLQDDAMVEVISVGVGNVERLATTIDTLMDRRYADLPNEIRASQKPLVITDTRSNSLLVAASEEDLTSIRNLIAQLEAAPSDPAIGVHVLALEHGSAQEIAPRIQRLMRDRRQSLGDAATDSDLVTIEADQASNSLIVAANNESLEVIQRLLQALQAADADGVGSGSFEIVQLASSRATSITDMLDELYVEQENRRRGADAVRVTADERLNAVLVRGQPRDIGEIKRLIAQLDGARPNQVVEIRYISLKSANALETVSLIETIISGQGIGRVRQTEQATVLKYFRQLAEEQGGGLVMDEMEVSAAIRETISLTPDIRTNTIIVRAPANTMKVIEQMIRDLDETSVGSKNIRIFKLTNADAIGMRDILVALFRLEQGNDLYVLKPREGVPAGPGDPGTIGPPLLSGTELTAVPDERQQLSITVDTRTNSLLVSGTPTYLDLVEKVVKELDDREANEREVFVYPLRNAVAQDVATVVSAFIDAEQRKLVETLSEEQLGSAARLLEREVTIQGDEKSNTVLVSASPRYMERVKEIIDKLDVDPPQVLIQVMLAEVTLDSGGEWGIDWSATAGTVGLSGFGLTSTFAQGFAVPNLTVSHTDFELMIQALKTQGRVQVLSNPSIMAANNELATIQIGETIQVPDQTSFTDSGQSNTSLRAEELGVILEVTPSINPEGFVRMDINPTISSLSQRTTQINESLVAPIITRRTADTTVTVPDGQTIIIGGLIQDRFEVREAKIPFFGDIPFIGEVFRSEKEQVTKTELLIVLTPHVIMSPGSARVSELTEEGAKRLTLPDRVLDAIRRGQIDIGEGLYDAKGNLIQDGDKPRRKADDDDDIVEDPASDDNR